MSIIVRYVIFKFWHFSPSTSWKFVNQMIFLKNVDAEVIFFRRVTSKSFIMFTLLLWQDPWRGQNRVAAHYFLWFQEPKPQKSAQKVQDALNGLNAVFIYLEISLNHDFDVWRTSCKSTSRNRFIKISIPSDVSKNKKVKVTKLFLCNSARGHASQISRNLNFWTISQVAAL